MDKDIKKQAFDFILGNKIDQNSEFYCETRDVFQARLDKMISFLLSSKDLKEDDVFIISAISGEIGNNSFDHNIGSWFGVMGVFFAYEFVDKKLRIILADAGQGVYNTLKKVKPELGDDVEALKIAFNERISGRAPESRGNGLKFVKANIKNRGMHLDFYSGKAHAELNNVEEIKKTKDKHQGCLAIISLEKYAY